MIMKILLTGATGYIGKRLLPILLESGHEVICTVRDRKRFHSTMDNHKNLSIIELDLLREKDLKNIPEHIDAAYYLVHSMSSSTGDFSAMEEKSALNFRKRMNQTRVKQVIYLSGISNDVKLSKHLSSRKNVETILSGGNYPLTTLCAGIIVGSGSASFEIIRDLVEKLPVMITPRWLNTKTQPIAVRNVLEFLSGVLLNRASYGKSFDIGGPEILTYRDMLLQFAKVRGLKRWIFTLPVMTPKLSSYWLYFVTSTSYKLAVNLVNSMKVEVIGTENSLHKDLNIKLIPYKEAVVMAFDNIVKQDILSSWIDAQSSEALNQGISRLVEVPNYGCYKDQRSRKTANESECLQKIWSIGGHNGWYYADWLWNIRGVIDKLWGGVGLRRGRKNATEISAGDSLDFWRVLYADKNEKRLLLYAEMKLPGEAWLEFHIKEKMLIQTATFRPLGLMGRLYWYSVLPLHSFIFQGMINRLTK